MVIDNSAGSEVRPLVLKSVVENGESIVTLAETSDLDLKSLYVNNYSHTVIKNNTFVEKWANYQVSISETDANLLSVAILNPSTPLMTHPYYELVTLKQVFEPGLVKTYRRYFRVQSMPDFIRNENDQVTGISAGAFIITSSNSPSLALSSVENNVNDLYLSNTEVNEDGIIVSLSGKDWDGLEVKVAAEDFQGVTIGDIFCVEFVLRNEGELSTSKLAGLVSPEQPTDAVNLEHMDAQVATLEAADQAQINYINQRVAELTDSIQNQDSLEVYSTARWANAKAVSFSSRIEPETKFLAHFNDASIDSLKDSSALNADIMPRLILNDGEFPGHGQSRFSFVDVNPDLQPGLYRVYISEPSDAAGAGFPSASYENTSNVLANVYKNPNLFEVRYYADYTAYLNGEYTVIASDIPLQCKITVDPVMFPDWHIGAAIGEESAEGVLPSYVTVEEGDRLSAGFINTIPGVFSWRMTTDMELGDNSSRTAYMYEASQGYSFGFEIVRSVELSDDSKFGGKSLRFNGALNNPYSLYGAGMPVVSNKNGILGIANKDFCIEGWFKIPSSSVGYQMALFSMGNYMPSPSQQLTGVLSVSSTDASIMLIMGMDGLTSDVPIPSSSVNDGQWHHIAFVKSGSKLRFYLDGLNKLMVESNGFELMNPNQLSEFLTYKNLFIGGADWPASQPNNYLQAFNGWIDEFRVVVGDGVYSADFTPPTSAFVADSVLPVISFPDMSTLNVASSSLGIALPNPAIDESEMSEEEIKASHIRKVYTAGVARNVANWNTPTGEVYIGPNGNLVETRPASGRIIRLGQKVNSTDLLLDIQDYGFISGVTTKRKKFDFGPMEPSSINRDGVISSFSFSHGVNLPDYRIRCFFDAEIANAASAKMYFWYLSDGDVTVQNFPDEGPALSGAGYYRNRFYCDVLEMPEQAIVSYMTLVLDDAVNQENVAFSTESLKVRHWPLMPLAVNYPPFTGITTLFINGLNLSNVAFPYIMSVPYGTSSIDLIVESTNPYDFYISPPSLTITGNSDFVTGLNVVQIKVENEGFESTYDIEVTVQEASTNTNLSVFTINGNAVADGGTFNVPYGTTSVDVLAVTEHPAASIEYISGDTGLVTGENTLEVSVISEAGVSSKKHIVTIVVAGPSTNTNLSAFTINGNAVADGDTFNVPYLTTSVAVVATPEHPAASIEYINGDTGLVTGENTLEVSVISEGGAAGKKHTVTIVVAGPSTNTNLSTFTIDGQSVADGDTFNVPYLTTSVAVVATPEHPDASIEYISGDTGLVTGSNTLDVSVISQGGAAGKKHTVTIVVAGPSTNTNLSTFTIDGQSVVDGDIVFRLTGTTSVAVVATPEHPDASIEYISGDTGLVDGDNTLEVKVISQGGAASKKHIVTIRVQQPA